MEAMQDRRNHGGTPPRQCLDAAFTQIISGQFVKQGRLGLFPGKPANDCEDGSVSGGRRFRNRRAKPCKDCG